ncbi:hypothetical protein YC2023_067977 [Brassica napus]
MHFVYFLCGIGTLKGVYDVKENFFTPTSNVPRAGPRNSGLNSVPYTRFYNRFGDYILLTIVFEAPTLVNATSSRAPPTPSSMGNTAGGGSVSRALVSDGGSILSSTGSMGGGGSMSRALISDGGSILSSTGSMGGGGSMSRGLISNGGSIMSSTESMGGGSLLSRALISDGGSIMSSMGSMDGSTEHNRSMMIGLQGFPQVYSMPGSSCPSAAGGHFQTHVQAMNSLSSMSLMNSNYMTRTLKGVYDVKENFFIPTSNARRVGPRNSGLNSVLYARFYNRFGDYILLTIVFGARTLVNATSSRAPPPPSSMGNTAGGGSMSRALVSDGGSILSSTGSMGGGGSMSRALIFDGGSILSSTGSMGGGGSMSRGLISDGGSIMSSTGSMGGGGLLSRALISDGGSIMSSMESMDGSTKHNRSMMIGLQGSPQVYSMPGSSYPSAAGGHFQTHVQAMNSLSSMSLMNSNYMTRTLKGVYDVKENSFIPTSNSPRAGPRNSGLNSVPYARFYNRFGDYILLTIG